MAERKIVSQRFVGGLIPIPGTRVDVSAGDSFRTNLIGHTQHKVSIISEDTITTTSSEYPLSTIPYTGKDINRNEIFIDNDKRLGRRLRYVRETPISTTLLNAASRTMNAIGEAIDRNNKAVAKRVARRRRQI